MYRHLKLVETDELVELRMNRPEVRNAFNREMIAEIEDAVHKLNQKRGLKVVIFSGEGVSFSSGFDLKQFASIADPAEVRATVDAGRRMAQAVSRMRAITVASVQGNCVGGGVVLAASCDFRLASESAVFRLPETDIGIPLAWGGVPLLVREAGPAFAAEFILMCRPVDAREAKARYMVNEIVSESQLREKTNDYAQRLARHSLLVLETTKSQLIAARQALCSDAFAFNDAHVLHSALLDPASKKARESYLQQHKAVPAASI